MNQSRISWRFLHSNTKFTNISRNIADASTNLGIQSKNKQDLLRFGLKILIINDKMPRYVCIAECCA